MAISTCVKCGNTSFEMQETSMYGVASKYYFVQCAKCGGVVGVVDYYNIGQRITDLAKALRVQLPE